jgi:hypothetical protein
MRFSPRMPLLLVALMCLLQGCMLHQSADGIRASLLKRTSIGTRYETVEAYVQSKGWRWEESPWKGPFRNEKLKYYQSSGGSAINVSKEMGAYLGDTPVFPLFQWQISGYWLFDSKNGLVDIYISKREMGL